MRRRIALPLGIALASVVLGLGAAVWFATRGQARELEVHIVCPGADLFVGSDWIGNGEGTVVIDRARFREHPIPIEAVPGPVSAVVPATGRGSVVLLENSEVFLGQAKPGGTARGAEIHSVLLEHRDETFDAGILLTRFSQEGDESAATALLVRGRGPTGKALHYVESDLTGQLDSWLDRLSGRPPQRLELVLELGPLPPYEGIDLEQRPLGVEALSVPPARERSDD